MADVKGINPIVNDLGHHLIQGVSTPWGQQRNIVDLDFHPNGMNPIVKAKSLNVLASLI